MAPRVHSLALVPPPEPLGEGVFAPQDYPVTEDDGTIRIEYADGSVNIDLDPDRPETTEDEGKKDFYRNLAKDLDESKLAEIATQLLEGIQQDENSRKDWLDTRALGIKLLGLKLEEPRGDVGTSSAPLEGMSVVRHPLLLEATISFQATARGELLPATGPVKIRNDSITKPVGTGVQDQAPLSPPPLLGLGGGGSPSPVGQPPPDSWTASDELAEALEIDMNHYLTVTATEYVPDTDRMLFYIGFGGDGFKKVYNCPLRRRPVSESVDAEDLIISNSAVDLQSCGRVTHKSKMRKSVLRRMQLVGAYLDVELSPPATTTETNAVEQEKQSIAGQKPVMERPEDRDYTIYEVHCELDLDEFAPSQFKNKGLPLPYRVTIEKDSRKVLSVVRRWDEDDEECLPKQYFVQFPFIRGLGFYGLGFIHVLGNTTSTLTACWREMVDSGMFANFPGFIYDKDVGRQLTNQFRVAPGGGIGLQVPPTKSIKDVAMPMPYKEVGASFSSFVDKVDDRGRRLAGTADIQIGEGKQEAPVGTTLALIEQATKMLDSVHKRLHWAQTEEFKLLKERFKEEPEAFWRNNKRPSMEWRKDVFLRALDNCDLVPVADPNNPTSLHRMAKAVAIEGLAAKYPQLIDTQAALRRVFRIGGIDPEGLFRVQPLPPPPDPRMEAIKQKAETQAGQQQQMEQDSLRKMQVEVAKLVDKAHDRESKERLKQMEIQLEHMKTQQEAIIHAHELRNQQAETFHNIQSERAQKASEIQMDWAQKQQDMAAQRAEMANKIRMEQMKQAHELQKTRVQGALDLHQSGLDIVRSHREHEQKMAQADEHHRTRMEQTKEMHSAKLEQARALARVQKRNKSSNKSK